MLAHATYLWKFLRKILKKNSSDSSYFCTKSISEKTVTTLRIIVIFIFTIKNYDFIGTNGNC